MSDWPRGMEIRPQIEHRLAQLEAITGAERLEGALLVAIEAAKAAITVEDLAELRQPRQIDLNDAATENLVADAIRRLAPEGAYVPLSVRYPWRFTDFTRTGQQTTLADAVVEALRGSAEVHDAERIPHMVAPLLALAEAIERGGLIPGPPPGPCPVFSPEVIETRGEDGLGVGFRYPCELRATHAGLHTAEIPPETPGLPAGRITWTDSEGEDA